MKNKNNILFLIAVGMLIIITLACGTSNEATISTSVPQDKEQIESPEIEPTVEEVTIENETDVEEPEEEKPSEIESATSFDVVEVGDIVELDDQTIRLNSIEYQGTILIANFSVENTGDSDLSVSSLLSFSAKNDDGTLLEQEIIDCGTSSFDGTVLPGDKLRGDICWSDASAENGIKIYYDPSLFSEGTVVWNAIAGIAEEITTATDTSIPFEISQLGDIVEIQTQTIRLNSVEYRDDILVTNFTIENQGDSDVNTSSIVSFYAKSKDGTNLEQEIFLCEPSSMDGKILPGDRLRGYVCWSNAAPDEGIKLYYEASLLGEGAIVWEANEGIAEPIDYNDAEFKVNTYKAGDAIQSADQYITLNNYEFTGDLLKVNFTIENQGSEEINVSSIISFYARMRDGTSLEQEFFDCGSSMDGTIIPGDKLTGDICWIITNPEDGIKIFYEPNLFDEGAVVWIVDSMNQ